jgi:hypothetical protein
MQALDDERWREQITVSPAQFYRAKSDSVLFALPLLNSPPELLDYLEQYMVTPQYDDFSWTSTEESLTGETAVDTGLLGFELMSVIVYGADGTSAAPYAGAAYDADTGIVTFPQQDSAGVHYELDFYSDGTFNDLTYSQIRLFGLAVCVVWDENFGATWLNLQPKIHDSSFSTVNEANYMDKLTVRLRENRQSFNDELHKYEQLCAYKTMRSNGMRIILA